MPRLAKDRMGSGAWISADLYAGRFFTPDKISTSRCPVCQNRMVQAIVDAGETTHPACAGWPPGMDPTSRRPMSVRRRGRR